MTENKLLCTIAMFRLYILCLKVEKNLGLVNSRSDVVCLVKALNFNPLIACANLNNSNAKASITPPLNF